MWLFEIVKDRMGWLRGTLSRWLLFAATVLLLSLVRAHMPELPAGEMAGQWLWLDGAALAAAGCVAVSLLLQWNRQDGGVSLATATGGALLCWCGIEAVSGLRQLYGFAASNHSLYALTGSFFNPGPYSGYLAMGVPVAVHGFFTAAPSTVRRWFCGGVLLLLLSVLPAGMSRSAWLAAGLSGGWVYACHAGWGTRLRLVWRQHRKRMLAGLAAGGCGLLLAGGLLFQLKPDSARGRLFMWRMSCRAVMECPWSGQGADGFAGAYGRAQEAYFAAGGYEPWEERVAGSPEYAFNEYLQLAVERGIPATLGVLAVVGACLYTGIRKRRYGVCGALLSLMLFGFSSYPLQLPVFRVTALLLLGACVAGSGCRTWAGVALLAGITGTVRLKEDRMTVQACREWMNARIWYQAGAYETAEKEYARLCPQLEERAAFLFEYGHGLHKQGKTEASTRVLKEAMRRSCDPMILNIIGKNCWQEGEYVQAERWLLRATHRLPGRIYPYYLLAKLYAEPDFLQPEKFEEMRRLVLEKEPKVTSTAVRQMREEVRKMELSARRYRTCDEND